MQEDSESDAGERLTSTFTIELGDIELDDEDVAALQSQITRLAMESARQKGVAEVAEAQPAGAAVRRRRGPYVKIIFVKAVPTPR